MEDGRKMQIQEAEFVVKNGKKLRIGYTTGSCAAAAASAAVYMLIKGVTVPAVEIKLPSGNNVIFQINNIDLKGEVAACSVTKDGGDDPDATHGMEIFARVSKRDSEGILIDGGEGIGRVTEGGLQCSVGEAAINPVPRKMIAENIERIAGKLKYKGGFDVLIYAPEGKERAKKTFNERLGILNGISILGTTGIVDPMSEKALIDTIKTCVDRQKEVDGSNILISPGNYGKKYCKTELGIDITRAVEISNYVGESLDYIKYKGFKNILFVGHTGKLIKTAAGIMNTHSQYADGRMEIIASHSAACGANSQTVQAILGCITTDKAFDLIKDEEFYEEVKKRILERSLFNLRYRLKDDSINIEVIMFTTDRNHIIKSEGADSMISLFEEEIDE